MKVKDWECAKNFTSGHLTSTQREYEMHTILKMQLQEHHQPTREGSMLRKHAFHFFSRFANTLNQYQLLTVITADEKLICLILVVSWTYKFCTRNMLNTDYSDTTKNYCAQWDSLEVVDGLLYRNWCASDGRTNIRQLVIPYNLRKEFVARCCLPQSPGQPQHLKYQNRIWWWWWFGQ